MTRRYPLKRSRLPDFRPADSLGTGGFTLIELLVSLAIVGILLAALSGVVQKAYDQWNYSRARSELLYQGNFAMDMMVTAVAETNRLLIPLQDNPATAHDESLRDILAITMNPLLDSDGDGFLDADNDHDGLVDEDIPADNNLDSQAGIQDIDDDGDGSIDESLSLYDNDENGMPGDDWLDGVDNDGDSSVDEDIPWDNDANVFGYNTMDNDGDGLENEDWLDPVIFLVSSDGTSLIQRKPVVNWPNGSKTKDLIIAQAEVVVLSIQRLPMASDDRHGQLSITLQLESSAGGTLTLQSQVRVNRDG
jgi:prepilin-type N-terminal cleavage/methylation domain-containing protein